MRVCIHIYIYIYICIGHSAPHRDELSLGRGPKVLDFTRREGPTSRALSVVQMHSVYR